MFGYVRPRKDELRPRDVDTYRAAYCGLCRALAKDYGFRARFLVNYDMTFLYLLRSAVSEKAACRRCFCPARIFRREACFCDEAGYRSVAACTVILCYHKLRDDVRDSGWIRGLPYRAASRLLRRAYRKAAARLPAYDALAREQLTRLSSLETELSPSIDATADAFAKLVAGCAADLTDPGLRRPMESLLYQVGRFIYLTDALDDLPRDCRRNNYNPLRYRFSPVEGVLPQENQDYLSQLTDASVNLAGAALELLPIRSNREILENILYLGLPAVFAAVKNGTFRARAKPTRKEIRQ